MTKQVASLTERYNSCAAPKRLMWWLDFPASAEHLDDSALPHTVHAEQMIRQRSLDEIRMHA